MGEPGSKRTKYTHPYPAHHGTIEVRGQLQPSEAPPFFLDFDSAIGSSSLAQESPAFFESFQFPLECHSNGFSAEEQTGRWVPVHGNLPNMSPALAGLASHLNFAAVATLPLLSDTHPTTGNDQVGVSSPLDFVKQDHVSATNTDSNLPSDAVFDLPDIWTNTSLYRLHRGSPQEIGGLEKIDSVTPRKRASDQITGDIFSTTISTSSSGDSDFIRLNCPSLFPCVPDPSNRPPFPAVRNPFLESSGNRHPTLTNRVCPRLPENGVIDGYIKMRLSAVNNAEPVAGHIGGLRSRNSIWLVGPDDDNNSFLGNNIPLLPPNFSTGMHLDLTDQKLWCFHLNAFCPGRMLLCDNYWENQVAAIAVKDDATRHALLAFSTAYVLDYEATEEMRKRANHHYRTAVRLIEAALQRQDTYSPGNEDAVVAAIILVLSNDIVNWESRRPKGVEPLWREGARAGRLVLDQSDPGYRYWKPQNVQSSPARVGNANWIAYTDICAQPVTPLTEENTSNLYSWLLAGSRRDVHRIQGITGLCPKLLHTFSQITHLAALLSKNPNGKVVPLAALKIRNRLKSFQQWCEASEGYESTDELFSSCILDGNGKVYDPVKVIELSAHAWVPAAEIYLHCRVYRKPRSHPHVMAALKVLVQCIKRLPCTGELFTSQSPFFPVTIMAILSYRKEDRKVSQDWFEVVLSGAQCRSSVPPVWDAIKELWGWLDEELMEPDYDEDQPMGHRYPWWEDMVNKLVKHSGVLSLV